MIQFNAIPSLKEMVKDGKKVKFIFYKDNELWYSTENGFEFPIPAEDLKGATFLAEDKAILFMRWIRKWLDQTKNTQEETQ